MLFSCLRCLALGCSLLVALPSAWCCILSAPVAAKEPTKARSCCRCAEREQAPAPQRRPAPQKETDCPCYDRNATAPDGPKVVDSDLSFPTAAGALAAVLVAMGDGDGTPVTLHLLSPPLRLLHCVWLC